MRRRQFITLAASASATWPFVARAQQSTKAFRIGYLSPGSSSVGPLARHDEFQRGLRELGYVEGQNIVIEYRFANGKFDSLPELASELVQSGVGIIVTVVTQASLAAKRATSTIPIVFISVSDPVGSGLVSSLARPGANVTGNSSMTTEVVGKSLLLLKDAVPKASPLAVLWNPDNVIYQAQILRESEVAASALGLQTQTYGVRRPEDFDSTFVEIIGRGAASLLVLADPMFTAHTGLIADLANRGRLPAMYGLREYAIDGGLMAYGTNYPSLYRQAASYVDKIIKGVKPADLPIEQPTKFDFVINNRTARSLGLTISPAMLALADEVIE